MPYSLKIILSAIIVYLCALNFSNAQENEYGTWVGTTVYFGDLNPNYSFKQARYGGGLFYRYNFTKRMALRAGLSYFNVAASDAKLSNKQPYQTARNLDFQSNIMELAVTYEFNFFEPSKDKTKRYWTPYFFGGFSAYNFSSYTKYEGTRYRLEPLGTEGQKDPNNENASGYSKYAVAIPFGGGIKVALNNNWTFQFELSSRKTFNDNLDDVSGLYPSQEALGYYNDNFDIAAVLYDRSPELGIPAIGYEGKQRGTSKDNDRFNYIGIGLTYTLRNNKCPRF